MIISVNNMQFSVEDLRCCALGTVSFTASEMAAAQAGVREAHPGATLLTSCQRLEAYGFDDCECRLPQKLHGFQALERLAAVAAGLESAVLGEDQVIGQVRSAFQGAPPALRAAADLAIASARRLRAEAGFDSHAGHFLDRALRLSSVTPGGRLLVLGAGAMGKLIAERGLELGFEVTVAARRDPHLGAAVQFVHLGQVTPLPPFEVIVGCLGSGAGEIAPRFLPAARLLIDLGTPRNFTVPSGPGAIAIADMLEDEAARPHAVAKRSRLRKRLDEILRSRLSDASATGISAVGAMRAEVEAIRKQELERFHKLNPDIPIEPVDALTRALLDKVLHGATAKMKELGAGDAAAEIAALFRR